MRRAAPWLVAVAAGLAGCGGGSGPPVSTVRHPTLRAPQASAVPADATRVIRTWSDTLRHGDVEGAARLFALPSIVQIQPDAEEVRIRRHSDAVAFNLILPCGARLLSTERDGRFVSALFRLTNRPGATCDAPGAMARTDFVIRHGRIAEWRRALDDPGAPKDGTPSAPAPVV